MEHKALHEMQRLAEITPIPAHALTRREKLDRWARLLDAIDCPLNALMRVEFLPVQERAAVRGDGTPLAVAYGDPLFREHGLAGDRLGDIMAFFELSHRDAHYLLCDCHFQGTMTSRAVAARVRSLLPRPSLRELATLAWARIWGSPAIA